MALDISTVVVLGAGASFAYGARAHNYDRAWTPPLTDRLFSFFDRPELEKVIHRHIGANALAARLDLAVQKRGGTEGMEALLQELKDHKSPEIRRCFFHIPPYLSDLFRNVSERYRGQSCGLHGALAQQLAYDRGESVLFVSLNYDYLLERDLWYLDIHRMRFSKFEDYLDPARQVLVYKPHGSCDWGTPIKPEQRRAMEPPDVTSIEVGLWAHGDQSHSGWEDYYPVLTAPIANKSGLEKSLPGEAWESVASEIHGVRKVLAIGTSGLDEHVWTSLAPLLSNDAIVEVVGTGDGATKAAQRIAKMLDRPSPYTSVYRGGYLGYMESEAVDNFARF